MIVQFGASPPWLASTRAVWSAGATAVNEASRQVYPLGYVQQWPDGSVSTMGPDGWVTGAVEMPGSPGQAGAGPAYAAAGAAGAGAAPGRLPWLLVGGVGLVGLYLLTRA